MIGGLAEQGFHRVILAGLLLLLAASGFAPAQSSPPNGAARTLPVINVTTRLVYVDVVVRDANGQPVHNLTQQDFRVEEDGRQQKVDFFAPHISDETPAPAAASAMAPTEFSNVSTQKNSPAVNMILFDLVNTPQLDQLYARRQLLKFLRELPQGQQIALFALSDRLHMIQSFTSSSDQLVAAASAIDAKDFSLIRSSSQIMNDADFLNNFLQAMGRDPGQLGAHMRKDQVVEDARTGDRRARVTLQAFGKCGQRVSRPQESVLAIRGFPSHSDARATVQRSLPGRAVRDSGSARRARYSQPSRERADRRLSHQPDGAGYGSHRI
jgi:VWFA-related protein